MVPLYPHFQHGYQKKLKSKSRRNARTAKRIRFRYISLRITIILTIRRSGRSGPIGGSDPANNCTRRGDRINLSNCEPNVRNEDRGNKGRDAFLEFFTVNPTQSNITIVTDSHHLDITKNNNKLLYYYLILFTNTENIINMDNNSTGGSLKPETCSNIR